jgi:integrase
VARASGQGWALKVYQKKTKEWVYIPIQDSLQTELCQLKFKGEKDGKRYWFWTTEGTEKTAQNNWYRAITNAIAKAKTKITFRHTCTPHTFRHTFAIWHLNHGMDIKVLSRLLGHGSVAVTEKHYAHATHSTQLALDAAVSR